MKPLSRCLLVVLCFYAFTAVGQKPKPKTPPTPTKTSREPLKRPTATKSTGKIGKAVHTPPPKETPSPFSEGVSAFKAGEYEKAEDIFRRAIKGSPQDPVLHYFLGRTLKRRADCVGALSAFSAARAVDTDAILPKEILAAEEVECQVLLTDIPAAPQASAATEARVALEEGQAAYEAGDYEAALKSLEQAQERRPNDAKIYYERGLVLYALGKHPEAMKSLLAAQHLDPQLGFASPEEYRQALSKTQVRVGANPGGGLRLFEDSFLNASLQAVLEALQKENFYLYQTPASPMTEQLNSFIKEHLASGRTVVFVTSPEEKKVADVAEALWKMELQFHAPALLVVANSKETAIRASDLPPEKINALLARAQTKNTALEKFFEVSLVADDFYQAQRFYQALQTWGGLSVAGILLSLLFLSWRRRAERARAAFSDLREHVATHLLVVSESLAQNRLNMLAVPYHAEQLVEAAEQLFFFAQKRLRELPPVKSRKLEHWMASEALYAVEEAGRKSKRARQQLEAFFGKVQELSILDKKFGCFFCARPIATSRGGYRTQVSFRGASQEVLTCRLCANQIAANNPPPVKMVIRKGRRRHWSQTSAFEPRYDFYTPRIAIEMLPAVEAWSELFGEEGHSAMPEGGTLTSMPALAPVSKDAAAVRLHLTENDNILPARAPGPP
jgi:tetratricopeptide (TPR) repeat protein